MIFPINNIRRADNAKNGIKLDIRFIERKGASKSLDMRRVCEKNAKTARKSRNGGMGLRSL